MIVAEVSEVRTASVIRLDQRLPNCGAPPWEGAVGPPWERELFV